MASDVEISNAALQKLGAGSIISLADESVQARACTRCYSRLRRAELRKHGWNFARARAQLAADVTAPLFTYANQFQLPSDFLRMLSPDPIMNINTFDWQIEGLKILTNDSAPLDLVYINDVTDPNTMDELFRDALSARMALEMCEELTQSNQKKADALIAYKTAIAEARRINAFENISAQAPEDDWVTVRA